MGEKKKKIKHRKSEIKKEKIKNINPLSLSHTHTKLYILYVMTQV